MPWFNSTSKSRLTTCTRGIQAVFNRVILDFDCTVLGGHRGKEAQDRAFREKKSKLKFPDGKHNSYPSKAIDVGPYDPSARGVNWDTTVLGKESRDALKAAGLPGVRWKAVWNLCRFFYFAGWVMATASSMGIKLRFGGDWDQDTELDDQTFRDLVHFEETQR